MLRKMMPFIVLSLFSVSVLADEFSVIDVRRNITLADTDPIYKDFYINAGEGSGLKKNLVVTAVRKLTIRDASGAQAYGEIMVPVGQLKVIAVFNKIAVAREFTLLSRDELPMLEQTGIMSGDRIDLQGSFIDTSKPKRRVAEAPASLTSTLVVAAMGAPHTAALTTPTSASPALPVTGASLPPVATIAAAPAAPAPPAPAAHEPASVSPVALVPAPQKLEKSADSGNNTEL